MTLLKKIARIFILVIAVGHAVPVRARSDDFWFKALSVTALVSAIFSIGCYLWVLSMDGKNSNSKGDDTVSEPQKRHEETSETMQQEYASSRETPYDRILNPAAQYQKQEKLLERLEEAGFNTSPSARKAKQPIEKIPEIDALITKFENQDDSYELWQSVTNELYFLMGHDKDKKPLNRDGALDKEHQYTIYIDHLLQQCKEEDGKRGLILHILVQAIQHRPALPAAHHRQAEQRKTDQPRNGNLKDLKASRA